MSLQDIKLIYINDTQIADIEFKDNDLVNEDGLETAVLISVFTDARAADDDPLPDALHGDKRGWWGDKTLNDPNDQTGSKLWLLNRSKVTNQVMRKAKRHIENALEWMKDDGIAVKIEVLVERLTINIQETMAFKVILHKTDGSKESILFSDRWEAQLNAV